jgi:hypothetical protein
MRRDKLKSKESQWLETAGIFLMDLPERLTQILTKIEHYVNINLPKR